MCKISGSGIVVLNRVVLTLATIEAAGLAVVAQRLGGEAFS